MLDAWRAIAGGKAPGAPSRASGAGTAEQDSANTAQGADPGGAGPSSSELTGEGASACLAGPPPLARFSAPLNALAGPSSAAALNPLPAAASLVEPCRPALGHLGSAAAAALLRPTASASIPPLSPPRPSPLSAEMSRRLRGLLTATVNFRDVELCQQPGPEEEEEQGAQGAGHGGYHAGFAGSSSGGHGGSAGSECGDRAGSAGGAAGWDTPRSGHVHPLASEGGASELDAALGGGAAGGGGPGAEGDVDGAGVDFASLAASASVAGGGAGRRPGVRGATVRKSKLVIIMVGLPGRGKTFLCNKLCCYLNWLGHVTKHFNVGQYRRRQRGHLEVQDAAFFDHTNEAGVEARNRALYAALDDMCDWLRHDDNQVAIFDATNTTEQRRNLLRQKFHGLWQYLFIETICSDPAILEQNYRNKMRYSPDYKGVDTEQAVVDFLARIRKYEEVYTPIEDRNLHYIKLIDMVTGRWHMDINRISGYIPGKIVFFLMQVCKAGLTNFRRIWLTRHGESQYNQRALIGGNSSLSERGERYARALPEVLVGRLPQDEAVSVAVWTSTLKRTIETARFLPFPKLRWKALDEINAGICDGLTYEQIAEVYPAEAAARKRDKLRYRYPSGESYMDVIQRIEPVIIELERERECVVVVGHQAVLRAVYAYFMGVAPEEIPRLEMPLHTLIELTPMPDGTMSEQRFPVDIDALAAGRAAAAPDALRAGVSPLSSFSSAPSGGGAGAAAHEPAHCGAVPGRRASGSEVEAGARSAEAGAEPLPASPAAASPGAEAEGAGAVGEGAAAAPVAVA